VPDETVEQCNRSHPKQSLRIGTACTLCIAASRSPCRRYQGRAICPFGGAGDTTATPSLVHDAAKTPSTGSPPAARRPCALARRQCAALLARPKNASGIRPTYSARAMSSTDCPLPLHPVHVHRHPDPTPHSTYCTNPHQTTPDQTKPTQTRPNYAKPQDQRRVPFSISRLNRVEMWRCIHFSNSQKPPRPPARVRSNQTVYQATHLAAHSGF
jgi:hypothetical protein